MRTIVAKTSRVLLDHPRQDLSTNMRGRQRPQSARADLNPYDSKRSPSPVPAPAHARSPLTLRSFGLCTDPSGSGALSFVAQCSCRNGCDAGGLVTARHRAAYVLTRPGWARWSARRGHAALPRMLTAMIRGDAHGRRDVRQPVVFRTTRPPFARRQATWRRARLHDRGRRLPTRNIRIGNEAPRRHEEPRRPLSIRSISPEPSRRSMTAMSTCFFTHTFPAAVPAEQTDRPLGGDIQDPKSAAVAACAASMLLMNRAQNPRLSKIRSPTLPQERGR